MGLKIVENGVFQENIITIGNLLKTDMPHGRPIGERHAAWETHRRTTCLIRDPYEVDKAVGVPSEVDLPDKRPI